MSATLLVLLGHLRIELVNRVHEGEVIVEHRERRLKDEEARIEVVDVGEIALSIN